MTIQDIKDKMEKLRYNDFMGLIDDIDKVLRGLKFDADIEGVCDMPTNSKKFKEYLENVTYLENIKSALYGANETLRKIYQWTPNEKEKKESHYFDALGNKHYFKEFNIKLIEVYHTELIVKFNDRVNYYVWNRATNKPYCDDMNEWESFSSIENAEDYIRNNL